MLVKCKGCDNKIERNEAFKIIVKGKNEYYCSETEYKQIQQEKENRTKLLYKIDIIFNETVTNTALHKELKQLADIYTYTNIYNYICDNESKLSWSMNKQFNNQFCKIRYFVTILKNNLAEYKPKKEEVLKEINVEEYKIKYTPKSRKKCLNDYLNEME